MNNRLTRKLSELKAKSKKALIPYLTAGYPNLSESVKLAKLFEKSGADALEIGIPFSDPIADGKTIQYASHMALQKGINTSKVFDLVKQVRAVSDIPIILMGYMNPFMRNGIEKTLARASKAGVDGLIVPDIIPEESHAFRSLCAKYNLSLIYLAAPNTPKARLGMIDAASSGFVYIVSIAGVTGARKKLPSNIKGYLKLTQKMIKRNPRIIGFGISGPEQVRRLKKYVDGVIVASALVEIIRNSKIPAKAYPKLSALLRSLRKELDN